jgi:hypothetical protein
MSDTPNTEARMTADQLNEACLDSRRLQELREAVADENVWIEHPLTYCVDEAFIRSVEAEAYEKLKAHAYERIEALSRSLHQRGFNI